MCRVLEVSTSGYYAWRRRPPSRRAQENAILSGRIAEIHEQSQGIYGSRRVHAELRAQGVVISWQRGVATKWWTLEGAAEGSNSEEGGTMVA